MEYFNIVPCDDDAYAIKLKFKMFASNNPSSLAVFLLISRFELQLARRRRHCRILHAPIKNYMQDLKTG